MGKRGYHLHCPLQPPIVHEAAQCHERKLPAPEPPIAGPSIQLQQSSNIENWLTGMPPPRPPTPMSSMSSGPILSGFLLPSDSLSNIGVSNPGPEPAMSTTHWSIQQSVSVSSIFHHQSMQWTPDKQKQFETCLACITASASLPLSWVDNIEWIWFVDEFLPMAASPSCRTLSH